MRYIGTLLRENVDVVLGRKCSFGQRIQSKLVSARGAILVVEALPFFSSFNLEETAYDSTMKFAGTSRSLRCGIVRIIENAPHKYIQ